MNNVRQFRKSVDADVLKVQPVAPERQSWAGNFADFFAGIVVTFISAFFVMVGFGAAHELWPQVPAAGYWTSFLLCLGLSSVGATLRGSRRWWSR